MSKVTKTPTPSKKGFSQPYSEVATIAPEMAAELLEKNTSNRKVNRSNVNHIKRQLLENKWMLNGESIKIAPDGEILDGQHRLIACCESEKPLHTVVMYNVAKDSKHTMDTGRNRSAVDVLSFTFSSKYAARIASAAKFVFSFNKGHYGLAAQYTGGRSKAYAADNTDIINFVSNTPEFIPFVEHSAKIYAAGDKCVTPKLFTGLHWVITQKAGAKHADKFFSMLATGIGASHGHPVFTIRKKLISMKMGSASVAKLTASQALWGIVKAWNFWLAGDSATQFRYDAKPIKIKAPTQNRQ